MSKKINCTVSKIQKYDLDTYKIDLSPKSTIPKFKSGQFLHLTIDEFDPSGGYWPESRVFSICSQFGEDQISIVYSVKGIYTKRMEDYIKVGKEVWIKLPFGEFIIENNSSESIFLIAGGTGISPFIPYLKSINDDYVGDSINLFYGVRKIDQFIFKNQLAEIAEKTKKFKLFCFSEDGLGDNIFKGKINPELILECSLGKVNCKYYLSGPPGMITYFKEYLIKNKIKSESIFIDAWE